MPYYLVALVSSEFSRPMKDTSYDATSLISDWKLKLKFLSSNTIFLRKKAEACSIISTHFFETPFRYILHFLEGGSFPLKDVPKAYFVDRYLWFFISIFLVRREFLATFFLPASLADLTHRPRLHDQRNSKSFERIDSIRETNKNFDSCNSCKRLGTIHLHELHESKFPFVSRIEFIRSKLLEFFCSCIRGHSIVFKRLRPPPHMRLHGESHPELKIKAFKNVDIAESGQSSESLRSRTVGMVEPVLTQGEVAARLGMTRQKESTR